MHNDFGITVEGILKKKKNQKVHKLKKIKTLKGSVIKIKTLIIKLKIIANFKEVIYTFPFFLI